MRARVLESNGRVAWIQPMMVPDRAFVPFDLDALLIIGVAVASGLRSARRGEPAG